MSTTIYTLTEAKKQGYTHIWADCDTIANNGVEWLVRNGYVAKSREDAYDLILNERFGIAPTSTWIWSIEEEIASA